MIPSIRFSSRPRAIPFIRSGSVVKICRESFKRQHRPRVTRYFVRRTWYRPVSSRSRPGHSLPDGTSGGNGVGQSRDVKDNDSTMGQNGTKIPTPAHNEKIY